MDIFEFIGSHFPMLATVCLILSFIFQVSRIPINPWGWLLDHISEAITRPLDEKLEKREEERMKQYKEISDCLKALNERMDCLDKKLIDTEIKEDDRYIKTLRRQIIDFADSIRNGKTHSREQYEEVLRMNEEYHDTLKKCNMTNGYIDEEVRFIKSSFQKFNKEQANDNKEA